MHSIVVQRVGLGALRAQPEMNYGVRVAFALARTLALVKSVKRSTEMVLKPGWALRIRAFCKHVLPPATRLRSSGCARCLSFLLLLEPCDFFFQPCGNGRFNFLRRCCPVERVQRLAFIVQWNVPARGTLFLGFSGRVRKQRAIRAWPQFVGLTEIQARRRIFKNILCPPLRSIRMPVSAVLQERKLPFQNLDYAVLFFAAHS